MKKNIYLKIMLAILLLLNFSNYIEKKEVHATSRVYNVPVQLWHSENSGRLSMGNNAVASIAQVQEYDGGAIYTIEFVPMQFMNMNGHLLGMSVYSGPLFSGGLTTASVISSYQDTNLSGELDNFPGLLQFSRASHKEDKIGILVTVDAMNEIMGGDASQNAILKFDWANAALISGQENNSDQEETKTDENNNDNKNEEEKAAEVEEKQEETTKDFVKKEVADFFKEDTKTKNVGLYNIDITAAYLNPLTGVTADGGTKNVEIGEGMSQGVISPVNSNSGNLDDALKNQKTNGEKRWSKAQLQRTKDGKLYATVRIHLINWVVRNNEQGPFIKVLQENGDYKLVDAKETNLHIEEYKDSYADYTFEVPRENFSAMIQMFVEPMNRPVRFFVEVNPETIKTGGVEGMKAIEEKRSNYTYYYIATGTIAVILLVAYYIIRKKKKSNIEVE